MSVAVPAYKHVCIAPDRSGSAVWLIGVSAATEGRLEAYSINLSNINSPTATLVANQSDFHWSSQAQKACFNFPGNGPSLNSPIVVQQFGAMSVFTNVYPNGTVDHTKDFSNAGGVAFISPKFFSLSGAVGDTNWFVALTNVTRDSDSHWTGLRLNGTEAENSSFDFTISQYPTDNPLVSVGAYVPTSNTPAQGYHIVFDNIGGGVIYTTLANTVPINNLDHILSLSNPQKVDMNGIMLTTNAVPVTISSIAYIIDQAPDGSTVLYTTNPGHSPKLQRVSVQGNVPPFSPFIAATPLNSQIVVYRTSSSGVSTSTFNSFDTVEGTWSGPGLISSSPSGPSKAPLGAIIGGVVGGLVVIALVAFLFIHHRRNKNKSTGGAEAAAGAGAGAGAGAAGVVYGHSGKSENYPSSSPPIQQNHGLPQLSQVHTPSTDTASSPQYTPHPQSQGYFSQVHTPSTDTASSPQYAPHPQSQGYFSQVHTPSTDTASSPQYVPHPQSQGYFS